MPRPIDPTCLDCSKLNQSEAIALHSPGGKGRECWDDKRCPRKRSHYRNRIENNAKQRGQYQTQKLAHQSVEVKDSIFIPVQAPPLPCSIYIAPIEKMSPCDRGFGLAGE